MYSYCTLWQLCCVLIQFALFPDSDWLHAHIHHYGVATISRLLKIIGLFCRISFLS